MDPHFHYDACKLLGSSRMSLVEVANTRPAVIHVAVWMFTFTMMLISFWGVAA